jgi:hypothetical protein
VAIPWPVSPQHAILAAKDLKGVPLRSAEVFA